MIKILFVHGLEGNENGLKVQKLRSVESFDVYCPRMPYTKNIWHSFTIVVQALRFFEPDIVVASSYGTILTILMIQMGIWKGRTILLATAMHVFAPFRLYKLPNPKLILFIHGNRDKICPIQPIRQWAISNNCRFAEVDDTHSLKTLEFPNFVNEQMMLSVERKTIDHSKSIILLLIELTGIVIKAGWFFLKRKVTD